MKKIIILLCAAMLSYTLYAQDFQGKAIYQTSSVMNISFGTLVGEDSTKIKKTTTMSVAQQDDLSKQILKSMQKEYVLFFNKTESLYKEKPKLKNANEEGKIEVVGFGKGTEGGVYKNTRERIYLENRDVFGKLFLIEDTLRKYDWKMSNESKQIGAYTCYKATTYELSKRADKGNNKNISKVDSTLITAWYTPQIPLSQGPAEYWGLPGFIIELNTGNLNILCSEIVLNPSEKIEIKRPGKGKKVNAEKFRKIYNEKVKELVKMYDSKRKKSNSK